MKLTKLQEKALLCLYRRAVWRSRVIGRSDTGTRCNIALSAGKQAGVTEPADLLRWDRIWALYEKDLVYLHMETVNKQAKHGSYRQVQPARDGVYLTPLGCQVASEMGGNNG